MTDVDDVVTREPGSQTTEPLPEDFDYSNTNYILLGMVTEQVTGQPVGEVFEEQSFAPLGLDETTWSGESIELPEPYAQGFTLPGDTATPEAPAHASHGNPSWGSTARALISDVEDLLVHGRAMGTAHGMLEPQTLRHPGHTDPRRGLHGLGPDLRTRPGTPTGTHHVLTGHRSRAGGETRRGRQCSLAARQQSAP
ncbi:serine hydrolase [Kocuria sp. SM24M-10]|uniref:serine hydrolase n=1 Tax=Kocuria sp. SM24M-10 TaxID=1660349 RepID=UPI00069AB7B9|nr:serine hydrolase [Kocuria sp. SM24M-10]